MGTSVLSGHIVKPRFAGTGCIARLPADFLAAGRHIFSVFDEYAQDSDNEIRSW